MVGAQPRSVSWVSPQLSPRTCPLPSHRGCKALEGHQLQDGWMGAKAELDAPDVFPLRFANVPEQGEVSKQIIMQDVAHPSPPSCPQLVLGYLLCLGGGRAGEPSPLGEAGLLHHK